MPRLTYRDRLHCLLERPLTSRDRTFVESLLAYYERKGKLTAGRAKYVPTLEERYNPENLNAAEASNKAICERLDKLSERVDANSWAGTFVESIRAQVLTGATLSERQTEIIERVEREHSDEEAVQRENWSKSYKADPTFRASAIIVAQYYQHTGYFRDMVERLLSDDNYIPSLAAYNKMTGNKYAKKVLAAHHAPAKYQKGEMVTFRASTPWTARSLDGETLPYGAISLVIDHNSAPITSAAKGAKMYKILPVGRAKTVMVEERYIMKARKLGKK
tara:strand:+ start:413 stop:1240 length:828 start_codon:yes stop_codon:yes gene_type:complete